MDIEFIMLNINYGDIYVERLLYIYPYYKQPYEKIPLPDLHCHRTFFMF